MSDRTLLLGIDTSREGDLALAEIEADGRLVLRARQQFSARNQSSELLLRLEQVLSEAPVSLASLAAIVVVNGPGSFTGLRLGISAAKGLAHAANLPVLAVSSLEVLACSQERETVAVLMAGRGEYYVRRQPADGVAATESLESEALLAASSAKNTVVVADADLAEKFGAAFVRPGAFEAIRMVLRRFHARDFDNLATLDANYVRHPYTEKSPVVARARES